VFDGAAAAVKDRHQAFLRADKLTDGAELFQRMAEGRLDPATLSDGDRKRLTTAASNAESGAEMQRKRVGDLGKYVDEKAGLPASAHDTHGRVNARILSKSLPYASTLLLAADETRLALSGEQTWAKSVATTAGVAPRVALRCSPLPPRGADSCSVVSSESVGNYPGQARSDRLSAGRWDGRASAGSPCPRFRVPSSPVLNFGEVFRR
jgi:hypothetical protein